MKKMILSVSYWGGIAALALLVSTVFMYVLVAALNGTIEDYQRAARQQELLEYHNLERHRGNFIPL